MTYTITAVPKNDGRMQPGDYFKVEETGFEGTKDQCERYCAAHTLKTKTEPTPTLDLNWIRMRAKLGAVLNLKMGQTRKIFDMLCSSEKHFILLLAQYGSCKSYAHIEGRKLKTIWLRFHLLKHKIEKLKATL